MFAASASVRFGAAGLNELFQLPYRFSASMPFTPSGSSRTMAPMSPDQSFTFWESCEVTSGPGTLSSWNDASSVSFAWSNRQPPEIVSCLTGGKSKGHVNTVNIVTSPFPATPTGDSDIDTTISLPSSCIAPIVFVMSGSEDKWFAVTGAELH